jgi:cbb3-type cytochrome oxidase subunit 3
MNKKQSKIFVAFISIVFIIFLIISFNLHKTKNIDLASMGLDDDIVVEFKIDGDYITGYTYDDSQGKMINNWIMGVAYSYYNNFYFFENCEGKINYLETYSLYNSLNYTEFIEWYRVQDLDFIARKNSEGCKLGIVLIGIDGTEAYRYIDEVNIDE